MSVHPLRPTRFHGELRTILEEREPDLLRWYASETFDAERTEATELALLRTSYRLSNEAHERPYRLAARAADALGVTVPITIYQLVGAGEANAALFFDPDHARVGLAGPVLGWLADDELTAVLGHELAHHLLWTADGGAYRASGHLVSAAATSSPSFTSSADRHDRWTEVFADRGSLLASGSLHATIRALVRIATGTEQVSAADYLTQAEEVVARLAKSSARADRATHPETAVRVVALARWEREGDASDDTIARWIDGEVELATLDLRQQRSLRDETRGLLDEIFAPSWFRGEAALALATTYFPDYQPRSNVLAAAPRAPSIAEYLSYVLLDFVVVDPDMTEVALAHAWILAGRLGLREALTPLLRKELKLTAAAVNALDQRALPLIDAAVRAKAAT